MFPNKINYPILEQMIIGKCIGHELKCVKYQAIIIVSYFVFIYSFTYVSIFMNAMLRVINKIQLPIAIGDDFISNQ